MIPIPPAKPKASLELVQATALKKWKEVHGDKPLPEFYVLAVRGYYSTTIGEPGNDISAYDDAFFIVSPLGFTSWNGNTDPSRYGLRPEGKRYMARLKPGCYRFISLIHRGKYQAFGQGDNPVTVERIKKDGSVAVTETGLFGINDHLGGENGTSSEGCMTHPPEQWSAYRKTLRSAMTTLGVNVYDFILVDGPIN